MATKSKDKAKNRNKKGTIITSVIFRPSKGKPADRLPSTRRLVKETVQLIFRYKGLFSLLGLSYLIANWLLIAFPFTSKYGETKALLDSVLDEGLQGTTGIGTLLIGGIGGEYTAPQTEGGQILASVVALLFILSLIFATRHLIAHENDTKVARVGLRDVLYNSPTPFISVILTMFITVLAMLPAAIGVFLVASAFSMDIAWWQQAIIGITGVSLAIVSLLWLIRLLFAFFVVTLPGARPIESIRETRDFVVGHRWSILWRLLLFGLLLGIAWLVLFVPFLLLDLWVNNDWLPIVPIAIGIINTLLVTAGTIYMYKLYRSLL
jgi:hypothetical protein